MSDLNPTNEPTSELPEGDPAQTGTSAPPQPDDAGDVKNPAGLLAKNRDLLERLTVQKGRIAELEGQLAAAQQAHEALKTDFDTFHVRRALSRLADEASPVPDVWLAEFGKAFDVRAEGDDLAIFDKNGARVINRRGEPLKLDADEVWWHLASAAYGRVQPEPSATRWANLSHYRGGYGSGARASTGVQSQQPSQQPSATSAPNPGLGLR